jgi:hypothetical protein
MLTKPRRLVPVGVSGRRTSYSPNPSSKGVRPITSVDDLAEPGAFESDAELEEFLADLYASRHADLG